MNSDQLSDQRLQDALKTAFLRGKEVTGKGSVATYIPELGKDRPEAVGLCIHTKDGKVYKAGDAGIRFTMQSVSKLLSLAMALEIRGYDTVFEHVGMEPSGVAFNLCRNERLSGELLRSTTATGILVICSFQYIALYRNGYTNVATKNIRITPASWKIR